MLILGPEDILSIRLPKRVSVPPQFMSSLPSTLLYGMCPAPRSQVQSSILTNECRAHGTGQGRLDTCRRHNRMVPELCSHYSIKAFPSCLQERNSHVNRESPMSEPADPGSNGQSQSMDLTSSKSLCDFLGFESSSREEGPQHRSNRQA